jgi:hypothetical protein
MKAFPEALARTTMAGMVAVLQPVVKKNASLGAALSTVSHFIASPLPSHYANAFTSVRRPASGLLGAFVSVVYARALLLLVSSAMKGPELVADLKEILSSPSSYLQKYLATQGSLHENFVGHLVTLAEVEAQLDPHFQIVMERATALFLATHRPKGDIRNPLADSKAGLDQLASEEPTAWWALPTALAFAITVYPEHA